MTVQMDIVLRVTYEVKLPVQPIFQGNQSLGVISQIKK